MHTNTIRLTRVNALSLFIKHTMYADVVLLLTDRQIFTVEENVLLLFFFKYTVLTEYNEMFLKCVEIISDKVLIFLISPLSESRLTTVKTIYERIIPLPCN